MQKVSSSKWPSIFLALGVLVFTGVIEFGGAADDEGRDGDNADCSQLSGLMPIIAPAVIKCMPREALAGVGGGNLGPRINCMGKCLFTELGVFGSDGQLNFTSAIAFVQKAFPNALSGGGGGGSNNNGQSMQKCLELTIDFKPDEPSCESYGPFFQCLMSRMSERMGPKARQCLGRMTGGSNGPLSGVLNIVGSTVSNGMGVVTGQTQAKNRVGSGGSDFGGLLSGGGGLGNLLGRGGGGGGGLGALLGRGGGGGLSRLLGGEGGGGLGALLGRGGGGGLSELLGGEGGGGLGRLLGGGAGGLSGLLGRDGAGGGLAGLLGGNGTSSGLLGGGENGGGMLTRILGRGGIGNRI